MRLDHINLCVPEGGVDAEIRWLVDLLGYRRAEPGPEIARLGPLYWFEADDGTQVHLTIDAEHRPSKRAHTAVDLGDQLDPVIARVEASGQETFSIANDGRRQVFATDPAGNLWELIGPAVS
ncbi:MAG TPA: VOC family protein [Acidimicrobiia bacterium]|nr:VOC family protein [Acidimicrobiia bacterium]